MRLLELLLKVEKGKGLAKIKVVLFIEEVNISAIYPLFLPFCLFNVFPSSVFIFLKIKFTKLLFLLTQKFHFILFHPFQNFRVNFV